MTTGPRPTNHSALPPRDDREALSALFDGELAPDAVRFAFKRIEHDVEWRDACGRWQLIGDVLRGQAAITAPASFAGSVLHGVAGQAEAMAAAAPAVASGSSARRLAGSRWPWMGGAAVAASMALVALFVVGPDPEAPTPSAGARVADTGPAGTARPAVDAGTGGAVRNSRPAAEGARTALASATPSDAADRVQSGRPRSSLSRAAGPRRASRVAGSNPVEADAMPVFANATPAPDAAEDPFRPAADAIATRPWPRAVLPGSGSQALTVGFGAPAAPSPSFYPFEPTLPPEQAPPLAEPQR